MNHRCRASLAALLLAVAGAFAATAGAVGPPSPPPPPGHSNGLVNAVISEATTANPTVEQAGVDITTVTGPVNKAQNYGIAWGQDCNGCRAVAIAYQVVFVVGEPSDSEPVNEAGGVNVSCDNCFSEGLAFQDVVPVPHPFPLSPAEQEQVDSIAQRAQALATSDDPDPHDIDLKAQALRDELWADVALWVKLLEHNQRGASFAGANLSGFDLHGYDFSGADFAGANLSNARLNGDNFTGANLSNANLEGADLHGARLDGANLTGADTTGASGLPGDRHGPRR